MAIIRFCFKYLILAVSLNAIVQLVQLFLWTCVRHNLVVSIQRLNDSMPDLVSLGHICVPVAIFVDFNRAVLNRLGRDARQVDAEEALTAATDGSV